MFYIMALARITTADIGAIADAPAGERENLSARLQSILDEAGVDTDVQDRIASTGHTTLNLFAAMGTDSKEVKEYLADVLDLDPKEIEDKSERAQMRMTITRLCSAHLISKTANEVEVRANAERSVANLPSRCHPPSLPPFVWPSRKQSTSSTTRSLRRRPSSSASLGSWTMSSWQKL